MQAQETGHGVLVETRNSAALEGFNMGTYGLGSTCGTPRCMIGWAATHAAGPHALGVDHMWISSGDEAFQEAMAALYLTRPEVTKNYTDEGELSSVVESVAMILWDGPELFAWLDRATALTAPLPSVLFVAEPQGCEGAVRDGLERAALDRGHEDLASLLRVAELGLTR